MNIFSGIAKNTVSVLLGTVVRMASSFILVIFVARHLGSTGMGKFSLILSIFWVFQTIASMNLQSLIVREVAKNKSSASLLFVNASFITLGSSIIITFVMSGFAYIAGYDLDIRISTWIIGAGLLFTSLNMIAQGLFVAFEKAELVFYGMTVENSIKLAVGIFILSQGFGIITLSMVIAFSPILGLVFNVLLINRFIIRLVFKINLKMCRSILRYVPTFAGISIFNSFFWNVDILILSKMRSIEEVGLYSAAMRMVGVIKLVMQSYKVAIQPIAAQTFMKSKNDFRDFCMKSLKYIFILSIPVCVGGTVLADPIILLLFGENFAFSANILRIGIWTLIPYGGVLVFASFLIASNNQKTDLKINMLSSIFSVVCGLVLIYFFGYYGSAAAILISISFFFSQQIRFIFRNMFTINFIRLIWRTVFSSLVMASVIWFIRFRPVWIVVPVGIAIFLSVQWSLGSFGMKDLKYLIELRKNKQ